MRNQKLLLWIFCIDRGFAREWLVGVYKSTCVEYNPMMKAAVKGVVKTSGVEKLTTCDTILTAATQHLD